MNRTTTTIFQTPRLILRELEEADHANILKFANDESIKRHLDFGSIATDAGARAYIESALGSCQRTPRNSYKLAMSVAPNTDLVGSCWLDIEDLCSRNATIGYFVSKEYWGSGYGTEMIHGLVEFAFNTLKLHRLYANCDANNAASRRLLEKAGMQQEGLLREHCLRSSGWTDVCMYGMLRSDRTA